MRGALYAAVPGLNSERPRQAGYIRSPQHRTFSARWHISNVPQEDYDRSQNHMYMGGTAHLLLAPSQVRELSAGKVKQNRAPDPSVLFEAWRLPP